LFTGLIREIAKVEDFSNNYLTISSSYRPKLGDSIAINGACLTVVSFNDNSFTVQLSPESTSILAIENYKNRVHMEPAMRVSDRLEGHIVQGHVDTIGTIKDIKDNGNSYDFFISCDEKHMKFVIPKGSITIDGISLTVNEVYKDSFRLTIIPHTMEQTLFNSYKKGRRVNIETDMFARYLYFMFNKKDDKKLDWDSVEHIMSLY
jgi:riboflavin synthase